MNNKHLIYGFFCVTVLLSIGLSAGRNKKRSDAPKPDQTEEEDVTRKPRRDSDVSSDDSQPIQAEEQIDQAEKERRDRDQVIMQFNHGLEYYYGTRSDSEQNYQKARAYFEAVANQERERDYQIEAQAQLGEMFYYGKGVVQDYEKARIYFESAINPEINIPTETLVPLWRTQAYAKLYLGDIYYWGRGVPRDYEKALSYFKDAVNQKDETEISEFALNAVFRPQGLLYLGEMYYWGRGVPQDYSQARRYFEEATQKKNIPVFQLIAIQVLGTMRHLGQGFEEQEGAETTCAICLDKATPDNPLKQLPCLNYHPVRVHTPCIAEAMEGDKKCPVCRSEMGPLVMPEHLLFGIYII